MIYDVIIYLQISASPQSRWSHFIALLFTRDIGDHG